MATKTLRMIVAGAALLSLSACNNDGNFNPLADGPVPMSFMAGISGVATRATATGFENGDMVGIIPVKGGGVEAAQANIAYTYNGSAFEANPPYYFQDFEKVTFNAYYPYDENLADDCLIEIDTRAANQKPETVNGHDWYKNDFLFASAETDVKAPSVSYTGDKAFKHVMSSIAFKFAAGTNDGVPTLQPLTGYTLNSLVMDGTFDCSTGEVELEENATAEEITIIGISCGATAVEHTTEPLIVLPQTVNGGTFTLTVKYNNVDYTASLSLTELEEGTRYEFPVTIKNTGLEIGTAEIVDWIPGTTTGGDATLQ